MIVQGGSKHILVSQFAKRFSPLDAFRFFLEHLSGKSRWTAPGRQAADDDDALDTALRNTQLKAHLNNFARTRALAIHMNLATANRLGSQRTRLVETRRP